MAGAEMRAGEDVAGRIEAPLLSHRLVLAGDSLPYLHIVPDGITMYLRGIRLKQIPVDQSRRWSQPALERTRIVSWRPSRERPRLVAQKQQPISTSKILESLVEVGDMPCQFSVVLENGARILVTTESADTRVFEDLVQRNGPASAIDVVLLQMGADQARQFYWLLQRGVSILY
jgi:hypothetical protein